LEFPPDTSLPPNTLTYSPLRIVARFPVERTHNTRMEAHSLNMAAGLQSKLEL